MMLEGKVVHATGGSRGIGETIVKRCMECEVTVITTYRTCKPMP